MSYTEKSRLEDALHAYLSDDNVEYIQEYYRTFYENPEGYVNDGLTDIILDDLNLERIDPWRTEITLLKQFESSTALVTKHLSPEESLAWGHFNHVPVYVRMVNENLSVDFIDMGTDFSYDLLNNVAGLADSDESIVVRLMRSDKGQVVAYCFKRADVARLSEIDKWAPDGWLHMGDFVIGDMSNGTPMANALMRLYVPFYEMANGSLLPIMWIDTMLSNESLVASSALELATIHNSYDNELCKDIYMQFKESFGPVDLETMSDKRYSRVWANQQVIVYNRNHTAYNGNISSARAVSPFLVAMIEKFTDGELNTNLYDIVSGKISDWDSVILSTPVGIYESKEVYENRVENIMNGQKAMIQPSGPNGRLKSNTSGKNRGIASGSAIDKLLQVASDDYVMPEEDNLPVYTEVPNLNNLSNDEINWIDTLHGVYEELYDSGVDMYDFNTVLVRCREESKSVSDGIGFMSFAEEYYKAFKQSQALKVNWRDLTTITKIIVDARGDKNRRD